MKIEALAAEQEGVVHRRQLVAIGLSVKAIRQRVATGRLHPRWRGVYAVGRAELTRRGEWMAAVLTCGPWAVLSHTSAAVLWGICPLEPAEITVSIPYPRSVSRPGIIVHRRKRLRARDVRYDGPIPATEPVLTLIDLAATFDPEPLEAAVNEAVGRRLTSVEGLRTALERHPYQPGVRPLARLLEASTFRLTQSKLERLFIPIALRAGLPRPLTQQRVNGYRVDFYWPDLRVVVETDGGAFHRTAAQQTRDRRRDQAHFAAGLLPLRFTHAQVAREEGYVEGYLRRNVAR